MVCTSVCIPFRQLLSSQVQYNCLSITSSKLLEQAVKESSYPPSITCAVMYDEELKRTGKPTKVGLHISGMDPEMEFQCKAYEQKRGNCSTALTHLVTSPVAASYMCKRRSVM